MVALQKFSCLSMKFLLSCIKVYIFLFYRAFLGPTAGNAIVGLTDFSWAATAVAGLFLFGVSTGVLIHGYSGSSSLVLSE